MKIIHTQLNYMFHTYEKYVNEKELPDIIHYENKVFDFVRKLKKLEEEFGFELAADYETARDGWTEAKLLLYDNEFGCIGKIEEVEEGE